MALELASSVAGLISLAGLVVQSASTLYTFCRNIPQAAGEVEAILDEIKGLQRVLASIQTIADDRATQALSSRTSDVVAKLLEEIKQCTSNLEAWNASIAAVRMENGQRIGNIIKKLKLAADRGRFSETRLKISSHREQLSILIEILLSDLALSTCHGVGSVDSKFDGLVTQQTSFQKTSIRHLESIEEATQTANILQSSTHAETARISSSTETIQMALHDIQTSQAISQQLSLRQAQKRDRALSAIQQSLLGISIKSKVSRNRRGVRTTCSRIQPASKGKGCEANDNTEIISISHHESGPTLPSVYINRFVDLEVRVRYQGGNPHFRAVAVPDMEFEEASLETKLRMVSYLQGLRLMIWLLHRESPFIYRVCTHHCFLGGSPLWSEARFSTLSYVLGPILPFGDRQLTGVDVKDIYILDGKDLDILDGKDLYIRDTRSNGRLKIRKLPRIWSPAFRDELKDEKLARSFAHRDRLIIRY